LRKPRIAQLVAALREAQARERAASRTRSASATARSLKKMSAGFTWNHRSRRW